MKRLIGIVLALLLVAPVSAQSPQIRQLLLRQMPVAAGGGGSAVLTFQSDFGWTSSQGATNSPNTFVAMPTGTAFANRKVIAVIFTPGSYNGAVTGVTIGGVTATFTSVAGSGAGSFSGIITYAWADVPTGTTANVVFTGGASAGDGAINCALYTFDKTLVANPSPTTNTTNTASATSLATTLNTGANGFLISSISLASLGSASSWSVTAATEASIVGTSDAGVGIAGHAAVASIKSGTTADTPTSVTWSWTTSSQALGGLLAWN